MSMVNKEGFSAQVVKRVQVNIRTGYCSKQFFHSETKIEYSEQSLFQKVFIQKVIIPKDC